MGILAAYAHRLKTVEGQWVETRFRGRAGAEPIGSRDRARDRRCAARMGSAIR